MFYELRPSINHLGGWTIYARNFGTENWYYVEFFTSYEEALKKKIRLEKIR